MKKYLTLSFTLAAIAISGCAHQAEPLAETQYFLCDSVRLRPYAQPNSSKNRVFIRPGYYEAKNGITVSGQKIPVINDEYDKGGWISVPFANGSKEGFYMRNYREFSYVHEAGRCEKISKPATMPRREGWNQW